MLDYVYSISIQEIIHGLRRKYELEIEEKKYRDKH